MTKEGTSFPTREIFNRFSPDERMRVTVKWKDETRSARRCVRTRGFTTKGRRICGRIDAAREIYLREKSSAFYQAHVLPVLLSGQRERRGGVCGFRARKSIQPKMALTSRCRAGGGENLSEELGTEDEGTNGNNFEPLSDSCGESDMEGLDLSLFEPQVDTTSWCDSRIHAGTLHILVHYCGKLSLHGIYIYIYNILYTHTHAQKWLT